MPSVNLSADIRDFRPSLGGWIIVLGCQQCGQTFEALQPTIAGVPLGLHDCSQCHANIEVGANDLVDAFLQYVPQLSAAKEKTLTKDATEVASMWYRHDLLAGVLHYKGANLAEPCQRQLLRHIMFGLYIDCVENGI